MSGKRAEKRRSQIIEAATEAFAKNGYHATRIEDIAHMLKIGHGTFYRYFKNKLDIFSAVVDRILLRITEAVMNEDPGSANSLSEYREQIHRIGERLYSAFLEDAPMARIVFYEALGVDSSLNNKLDDFMLMVDDYIGEYLENGMQKGFLKADLDVPILSKAINAMLFFGAKDIMSAPASKEISQRWTRAVSLLMLMGMGAK